MVTKKIQSSSTELHSHVRVKHLGLSTLLWFSLCCCCSPEYKKECQSRRRYCRRKQKIQRIWPFYSPHTPLIFPCFLHSWLAKRENLDMPHKCFPHFVVLHMFFVQLHHTWPPGKNRQIVGGQRAPSPLHKGMRTQQEWAIRGAGNKNTSRSETFGKRCKLWFPPKSKMTYSTAAATAATTTRTSVAKTVTITATAAAITTTIPLLLQQQQQQ